METRWAMKRWGMVALGLAVLAAPAHAQTGTDAQRAEAARARAEARNAARADRFEARQQRLADVEAAQDARREQVDTTGEVAADREVRFERPELGGPRLEGVRPSETSLRDPSNASQPSPLVTLSPGFGAGAGAEPTVTVGPPAASVGFTGTAASAGSPVFVGGSDVTFNTQNFVSRTVVDPRVRVVGVPVPTVGASTYVFQSYVRNEANGARQREQQRQQLPAADAPVLDHTEALRGLIDSNIDAIQAALSQYRLVDANRVLEPGQRATLRQQIAGSQVATGSRNILTRALRERRAIRPEHVVVGVLPARAAILVSAAAAEDN